MELVAINPEKWIIQEALNVINSDMDAGKAWLLTARSLYPRNLEIHLELYKLEKNTRNAKRAASLLQEMLVNFPGEKILWDEVTYLTDALQADVVDEKSNFFKDVFEALPAQHQCGLLLQVVEIQSNMLRRCRLMTFVMQRYPETVAQHGLKLLESLLVSEENSSPKSCVNCYRKYFVCDILTLVLRAPGVQFSPAQLLLWLQKSIEFYIGYMTITNQHLDIDTNGGGRHGIQARRASLGGPLEKDTHVADPWKCLVSVFNLVGFHLSWSKTDWLQKGKGRESQWQHVQLLWQQQQAPGPSSTPASTAARRSHLFHAALFLALDSILGYATKMGFPPFTGAGSHPSVLFEGMRPDGPEFHDHKAKRAKEEAGVQVLVHKAINGGQELQDSLKVAVKCWQLLHSSPQMASELGAILQRWGAKDWLWLTAFTVDYALYQGSVDEIITILNGKTEKPKSLQMRTDLQLACSYYAVGNIKKCFETVMNLMEHIDSATSPSQPSAAPQGNGRLLHILPCEMSYVLPCCIHLLITCLKEKAYKAYTTEDPSLGHLLVLLQYDWPRYEYVFTEVIDRIRRRGSFKYNLFFNYIINIDFLEEFAYLMSNEGGKLNLDILLASNTQGAQSRTVTRGVNKGVKEDFRVCLDKQVVRSVEKPSDVIRQFLIEEKALLQQCLA